MDSTFEQLHAEFFGIVAYLQINMTKKCKNTFKNCAKFGGGFPGMTTWFNMGVGKMTMFDHEGGGGVKISENLTTWYINAPVGNWKFCAGIETLAAF